VSAPGRQHLGWVVHETGPADAEHTVLLLPGGLGAAAFFDDVVAEPALGQARLVATTLPGFGGTPRPDDLALESYAGRAAGLVDDLGCDVVVGHSLGANLAIEMAASGAFSGPVVLLAPTFSREDESRELRMLDRIGRVPGVGLLAWAAMLRAMPRALKESFPPARRDALAAVLQNNDARFCRAFMRRYLQYLDRHGSLASRLCASGVKAWVVFGDRDGIGMTTQERGELEACPRVTVVTIPDAGHFALNERPETVASLIAEAAASTAPS
jgi:pimeloyl-ACP methyl ester carboxylesterase